MPEITVRPAGGGRFAAYLNDRHIVTAREPLLAAARALLDEGADPTAILTMRHQGAAHVSLTSPIGRAARLTVLENDNDGPRLIPYRAPASQEGAPGYGGRAPAAFVEPEAVG